MEEVMVTAQKREQSMQDIGVSVTTMSGEQMSALGYQSAIDVTMQAPAVEFSSFHQSYAAINIRGVSQNDFADHLEPPVAIYVDEAYVPHPGAATAQMFDMERVEVLRGPQGTLFGRNATGGLLHLISKAPSENFEGFISVNAGEYNLRKIEGAVSGAITDDLNGRISFYRHEQDGWYENRIGEDLMDADNYALRAQFDYALDDNTAVYLKVHSSRNNDESGNAYDHTATGINSLGLGYPLADNETFTWPNIVLGGGITSSCPGCDLVGFKEPDNDPRTGSVDHRGSFNRDIDGATFKIKADFDGFSLVSVTDYMQIDKYFDGDIDGTPNPFFVFSTAQESKNIAQELRVDVDASDSLTWMAGVYYLEIDSTFGSAVAFDVSPYLGIPNGSAIGLNAADYDLDTTSVAVFGHLEYTLSEAFTLIAGLRYTEDEKEIDYLLSDVGGTFAFNTSTYNAAKQNFENISARLELDWHISEDWMIYGSYNRGHKAGNFAAPTFGVSADPDFRANILPTILPHDEEVLTSTEIGAKGSFWGGKARLNASIYYYDYKDYQVFSLQNAAQAIFNRDATISGGELELTLNPVQGLDVMLGMSSMWDKTVEDVPLPSISADREMPMSPDYTFNGLVRYEWSAFNGYIALQGDVKWTDEFYFYALNEPVTKQDSYAVTNARVSYTTNDEKWSFALWGKNLGETDYNQFALDIGLLGMCSCSPSAPRWIGGYVKYQWQ
jgi:iron complex outermembrane receptor protein